MPISHQPQQGLEIRILEAARGGDIEHVVDDDRHLFRNVSKSCGHLAHQPPVAEHLHDPAEIAHRSAEHLENIEADAANIAGPARVREKMETKAAHAEPVPVAQRCRRDARVGDGDTPQPFRIAIKCVEQDATVEAVRIALHQHARAKPRWSSKAM